MEIKKCKDLIKLIQYSKEPSAFYFEYLSGNKTKHILWKYKDFTELLSHIERDLDEKGIHVDDVIIESVEVCMNLLDSKRFIKVYSSERSLID